MSCWLVKNDDKFSAGRTFLFFLLCTTKDQSIFQTTQPLALLLSLSFCFSLSIQDFFYSLGNILSLWSCQFFQAYCIRHWYICSGHPNNWSIEVVKSWAFNYLSANFGSNSVLGKASCKNENNKIESRYICLSIESITTTSVRDHP